MQLLKLAACRLSHCTLNICRIMYHAIDRVSNKRQMVENTYASVSAIFTSICKKYNATIRTFFKKAHVTSPEMFSKVVITAMK